MCPSKLCRSYHEPARCDKRQRYLALGNWYLASSPGSIGSSLNLGFNACQKTRKHLAISYQLAHCAIVLLIRDEFEISAEQKMVIEFARGAHRNSNEARQFSTGSPATAFSQVCADRDCRSAHLRG